MYDQEKIDDFILRSESIAKNFDKDESFTIISTEIDNCDDRYLHEYITALNFIRHEKVLDWIEINSKRIVNITQNWGHLAAMSHFSLDRAEKWLTLGRPLSIIALDALVFCTTIGERLNQSLWMREIQPKLTDNQQPEVIAKRLQEYLQTDRVPRTRNAVDQIIDNIFEV